VAVVDFATFLRRAAMRIDATIYMWGDNLDPGELTSLFGLTPQTARRKGEETRRPNDEISIARTGSWVLSTARLVTSDSATDHLTFLTDRFSENIALLKDRGMIDKVRISIMVSGKPRRNVSSWGDELETRVLSAVVNMGASLSVTVLYPTK
jgi:hypothetical protein